MPAAGFPARDGGGLEPAVRAELGQDAFYVAAQGAGRDVHLEGHLRRLLARDDPAQHLRFAGRQHFQRITAQRAGRPGRFTRELGIVGRPAVADHVEGTGDRGGLLVFAQVSRDPDLPRRCQRGRVGEAGQNHDLRLRLAAAYLPRRVQPVAVGETQIQQAGVRPVRRDRRDAVGCAGRDGQHPMAARLEDGAERLAQHPVVVTQNQPHRQSFVPNPPGRAAATGSPALRQRCRGRTRLSRRA